MLEAVRDWRRALAGRDDRDAAEPGRVDEIDPATASQFPQQFADIPAIRRAARGR
jgi:hypothetical protein